MLSIAKRIQALTDEEMVHLCDSYTSATKVLNSHFNCSGKGNYTVLLNNKRKELNLEWKNEGVITKKCPVCNKSFTKILSAQTTTCGYSCSNTLFRSGKDNPNYKHGDGTKYRAVAFRHYEKVCNRCGFLNEEALVVHHKDRDRSNNSIDNLEILCSNCHMIEHKNS